MEKFYVIFKDKVTGEWAGTIDKFKTKKECEKFAKDNAKLNNLTYKIESYFYNPYFGM